jgi:hypothetical protein
MHRIEIRQEHDSDIYVTVDGKPLDEKVTMLGVIEMLLRHFGIEAEIDYSFYEGPDLTDDARQPL